MLLVLLVLLCIIRLLMLAALIRVPVPEARKGKAVRGKILVYLVCGDGALPVSFHQLFQRPPFHFRFC